MRIVKTLLQSLKEKAHKQSHKLQTIAKRRIEALKKIDPKKQRKILMISFGLGVANLLLSFFSIYTLISFGIIVISLAFLIKINLFEIQKNGLIAYIPPKFHEVLLKRSLFDIICDIWFIPKITIYIKALVSPFILKIDPSEAVNQFKEFPPGLRNAILTKGLVHLMPDFVKQNMLPPHEIPTDDSSDVSFLPEDGSNSNSQNSKKENEEFDIFNETHKSIAVPTECLSPMKPQGNGNFLSNGFLNTSTDDDSFINHKLSFNKGVEVSNNSRALGEKEKKIRGKSSTKTAIPRVEKKFLHDSENDLSSESLNLTKVPKKLVPKARISETWDQLELFTKMQREKLLKEKLELHLPSKRLELKGPLQSVQRMAMLLNKEVLLDKLDGKKLSTIFVASSLAMILQFSISKKTRYWCYNTIHILLYIAGITLSTGTMAILAIKLKAKYKKWKQAKALKMLKANKANKKTGL